ncbi:MAG: restriction endonuclease subunit S [Mariprofundaceae bacterium]|nr:restriction endonuclease subunit S [Mariprofundaceae bacterium]
MNKISHHEEDRRSHSGAWEREPRDLVSSSDLFCDGDWVESKDQDKSGSVRLIQLADIGDGFFTNKSNRFMNIETAKRLNCTFLKKGDLLIARMPDPLGRCCVFPFDEEEKYVTVVDIAVLRLKDNFENSYVKNMINSSQVRHDIFCQITGTTRQRITRKKLEKLKIPLPPLAEQKKIASILDAADRLKQKDQQLIAKYNALSQSLFLDMFGDPVTNPNQWKHKALGDICGVGSGKRVFTNELVKEGVPFYRGTEVGHLGEGIKIKPKLFITKKHYEELKKHTGVPQKGDLLLPSICADGRIYIVSNMESFYFKDGRVLWIKVNHLNVSSVYLKSSLQHVFHTNYSNIASGTTFAELKIIALKKVQILLPPITLQNQFAERIQAIEAQKKQAQAALQKSEDLFNSLLQRAFKGELTA